MTSTMALYPESPIDPDDVVYPCKGCGEILEEGKAFELAGHRWHLECFKCNTCHTVLDSDANLLLLGDGSLICNDCTYSCNACGNKIQDLAILTGDQAYCAGCFRCRNCKKKIENLRYARTSQGMFCMECHDALMARRRKKTKNASQRLKQQGSGMLLDKTLPSLPPGAGETSAFSPESDRGFSAPSTPTELPGSDVPPRRQLVPRSVSHETHNGLQELDGTSSTLAAPNARNRKRHSVNSDHDDGDGSFLIPINLDPSLVTETPPAAPQEKSAEKENTPPGGSSDYFNRKTDGPRRQPYDPRTAAVGDSMPPTSPRTSSLKESARNNSEGRLDVLNHAAASPRASEDRPRDASPLVPKRETENDQFQLQEAPGSRKKTAKDTIFAGARSEDVADQAVRRPSLADQVQHTSATSVRTDASSTQGDGNRSSGGMGAHPKRGDSLAAGKANSTQTITRKEVGSGRSASGQPPSGTIDSPSSAYAQSPTIANGGPTLGKSLDSPVTKNAIEFPQRSDKRPVVTSNDSFPGPRSIPEAPPERKHGRNASISHIPAKPTDGPDSPPDPARTGAEGLDDKLDEQEQSFLKRVSNSVRHARSNSDRAIVRNSRDNKAIWPKSPLNGSATAELLAGISPSIGSPESVHKDIEYYKNQLQQQRARNAEQEKKIAELKEMIEGPKVAIKQMNTELREKRSTMVFLKTQKEIAVRELELLQPMAAAKKNGETPDVSKNTDAAVKDFSSSLQKLKDQFAPEIEGLMEKKTILSEDIAKLTRERDRLQQEFDALSLINQRLMDATNENAHARIAEQANVQQAQGLGIYGHNDRFRDLRPLSSETNTTTSTLVPDLGHEEPVIVAPKVIDVRKNNKAKFNWKKGGIVAKTVGKGLKDAFSSDRSQPMEHQNGMYQPPAVLEGTPYGTMQAGQYPSTTLPKDYKVGDVHDRQAAAALFNQQKGRPGPSPQGRSTPLNNMSQFGNEPIEPPHKLYGSLLQARADFEGVDIPGVVVRCVQEVQSRGMDVEGIYRKSGSSIQVNEIKAGFEKSSDYDISDVDLDIHAVTGALKQFFRKLPNPLITFEVYDKLIATAPRAPMQPMMGGGVKGGENGGGAETMTKEDRIRKTREALAGLPKAHGATLSFLVFHLAKVRREETTTLMNSMNLAVVFAPTIMRPVDIAREMIDTACKNDCVRFMIENCEDLFLRG